MDLSFGPLNAEKILNTVEPIHQPRLAKLEILEEIGSTNQYLLDHAKTGPSGWACLAEQQTAGRGRLGRPWVSAYGSSILCSLLWRFPKELTDVSSLSIAVGVMLAHGLKKFGTTEGIQLKWPNDILCFGRKLAGILLERRGEAIVIGFGLNVCLPRPLAAERIDLSEMAGRPLLERSDLAGLLLNELLRGLLMYQTEGLAVFMDTWREHDFLAGKEVTVHMPEKVLLGMAQGINEQGELLVLDQTRILHRFCYGDVSVRQLLP